MGKLKDLYSVNLRARTELKEIELIEKFREEQMYEPDIQFKK
jgi:hypothetical protein